MGYKEWLEKRIVGMSELIENSIRNKCYTTADNCIIKLDIYRECLAEFGKKKDKLDIHELKIDNKYIFVTEYCKSDPFIVIGIRRNIFNNDIYVIDVKYKNDDNVYTYIETDKCIKWYEEVE